MSIQVSQSVMETLDKAVVDGSTIQLVGTLDRKLYVEVNKVLEAAGGKWNRKAKAHVFDEDAMDAIEPILLTGEYTRTKQDFGQFDSPPSVVSEVIARAALEAGMKCLEPSAGLGNIAVAAARDGAVVTAYEIDGKRYARACAALQNIPGPHSVFEGDFMSLEPNSIYDRVLMNPPFSKQMDILHVKQAHKFLKPGGLLIAVMSASVFYRENSLTVGFRRFVEEKGGDIERLPDGAFKESGTAVNTCIVTIPN